ncbi:flavin-binding monooxygenase [Ophiostoma piceae UAMH 11346]|uniref:Flavin-binding monooxygenase n=1 Tax=Ophiostoma piceae (strain UAMH 11346) TaxID=1262450 RepID=S3D7Y7_OPHP1|nr:flavin-binding monooxygenase [Ophiostoma piceae UAMH 11346]
MSDLDVVIVGAGLSGLNSAYLLQTELPDIKYTILERRNIIGGTWAFWKYPGARSDSSSAVFRFAWHPWPHDMSFPDAPLVQAYAADAAKVQGIDKHIRFNQSVGDRHWSTDEQKWTVDVTDENGETSQIKCRWLINCSGYYSYEQAQQVDIPGIKSFKGEVKHPQFWSDDIELADKRVVLLGSGATAITMLPHIAKVAKHTTMVQRSPSYVLALPRKDTVTAYLRRFFILQKIGDLVDWYRQIIIEHAFVYWIMAFPTAGRKLLRKQAQKLLPEKVDVDVHFNPKYNPFEQRLCMSPDADFYRALHRPNCDIVTGAIETVTETGIRVKEPKNGEVIDIPADMIITATGLHVELLNGRVPIVDGTPVDVTKLYSWRSCMVETVPNFCFIIGYTTGTWTPGADAHFRTVIAVMKEMRKRGASSAIPTIESAEQRTKMAKLPVLSCSAGYLEKARDRLPISSGKYPWTTGLTYFYDVFYNYWGNVRDGMKYVVSDKKNL